MKRFLIVALLLLSIAPATASAGGSFAVSPVQLDFTDPPLLRGQSTEGTLRLHNQFDERVRITLHPEGAMASWVSFDEGDAFEMAAGESRSLRVRVQVPESTANGDYAGLLKIRATGASAPQGSAATLVVEVLPSLRARVGGEQVLRFDAQSLRLEDRPPGSPLVLAADVLNLGNVRAAPAFDLVVRDDQGVERLRERLVGNPLDPRQKALLAMSPKATLPEGLYTAHVQLAPEHGGQAFQEIFFEVRRSAEPASPPGAPASGSSAAGSSGPASPAGRMDALTVDASPQVGRPTSLRATFVNDGAIGIHAAKLTAEVYHEGQRVAVVTSDALRAPAGATIDLEAFYTPASAGAHTVKAYVVYDGVRTPLKETAFAVSAPGGADTPTGAADGASNGGALAPEGGAAETPGPGAALAVVALGGIALAARRRG